MPNPKITNSCKGCTAKCCRGLAVVLTIPEARRLSETLGLAPEEYLEFTDRIDSKKTPHYPLMVKDDKEVREYFIVLKRRRKTDCVFLDDDSACAIYSDRPSVCRLYPFELDGGEMKKTALCPVKFIREKETDDEARRLREDLFEHGKIARKWNVEHGRVSDFWLLLGLHSNRTSSVVR